MLFGSNMQRLRRRGMQQVGGFGLGLGLGLSGLLGAGCVTGRPDYTVNVPPNLLAIRPPQSVLFVEAPLSLAPLEQQIDQVIGRVVPPGRGGQLRLGMLEVGFRLSRQPISIVAAPPGLSLRLPLTGDVSIGAGFLRCQAGGVGGTFTVGLRPTLDAQGALVLRDAQVAVSPLGGIQCVGLSVPTPSLFSSILDPISQGLSGALSAYRLPMGPAVQEGLRQLATPRGLTLAGQPACLDLAPGGLVLAPPAPSERAGVIALKLGVEVAPRVSLGPCPPTAAAAPAPSVSVRDASLGDDFRLLVAVAVPTSQIEARLRPQLVGKRLGSGATAVLVTGLAVGDASGRLLLKLDVVGAFTGAVYLWGTPEVREEAGVQLLRVPDLKLAAESQSAIENLKLSLAQLWEGDLAARLREQLVLDVSKPLADARQQLSGTLALQGASWQQVANTLGGRGLSLSANIAQVLPQAVISQPGVLVVHTLLVGRLRLNVQ